MHAVTLVEHRCGFKEPHVARPEIMIVLSDSNEAWNEARTEDRLGRGPIIINFEDPMPEEVCLLREGDLRTLTSDCLDPESETFVDCPVGCCTQCF